MITTNLNVPPYFDDFDINKDFVRILFQPGVSVQVRELNQIQSMFQKQIERFGDNIFATGTIVSGCNFAFLNPYPYVKIKDLDTSGQTAIPFRYVNYNVINEASGLIAWVTNYTDGFESADPDLKTLFLTYQNTGNATSNTLTYSAGDVLKVYDPVLNGVEKVIINNGGVAFSNTDQILAISPVVVTIASGSISPGDFLINNLGANVEVVTVDATTLATSNQSIITIKPRAADLANTAANTSFWTLLNGQSITNPSNTVSAVINRTIGSGFTGRITTDGVGTIIGVSISSKGVGYTPATPYMTIRSINNTTGYSTLNLVAQNYLAKITVATNPSSVGNGYGFSITEGVIYQKGYFLRVVPQLIIVSKYSQFPDNVAVGFITNEQIINYNIDSTLLDNVNNTENEQAPGADRLKLVPVLQLVNTSVTATNSEFLPIVEWKEGRPFKQQQSTIYSTIGDEMARRTEEASGDFVIDPFLVTTRSPLVANNEGELFNIVIDPGKAYIGGYRVETTANFNLDDEKGTNTAISNSHITSLNYGNYVVVNNLGGTFQFNIGDTVDLYDTARGFLATPSLITAQTLLPGGTKIGTANMRSLLRQDNSPGSSGATYRLYLFNIQMNAGKNFRDVKAFYYNGTLKGVADAVTTLDPTTSNNILLLNGVDNNRLTFDVGVETLMNANNVLYYYRTIDATVTVSNGNVSNATLVKDISGTSNEFFPYTASANLTAVQMVDLYVVPTSGELVANAGATGTVASNTTTANIVGTTTTFLTDFAVGDWVYVTANSTGGGDLHQIVTISNNTFLTINSNNAFTNATAKLFRAFPQNVPIPFGTRSGLTANVNINQNILTLDFGRAFSFSGNKTCSLAVNIQRVNPTQLTKTPNRNRFVRIACSNNAGGTTGPWCIGVPDIFRLDGVYIGNSTVSNTGANHLNNFYIDHNQNSNYYDLGWLFMDAKSPVVLGSSDYLLIQFDYFTATGTGFYDTVSYTQSSNLAQIFLQDSQPLSNLASVVNSFEIPELFFDDGTEIDLMNQFDFRPMVANTVAPTTNAATAPLNPANTVTLSTSGEKKFPLPDSAFTANIEFYIGRLDSVFVDKNGGYSVLGGPPNAVREKQTLVSTPDSSMKIIDLVIPPYPNLPTYYSVWINQILNTRVLNQKFLTTRIKNKTISIPTTNNVLPYNQPRVYTEYDIGNIDRRLRDVEYEVSLSALEAGVSDQFIPSSVDPTMDRFKFGFFVDDLTTAQFSDLTNPQYAALKEDTCLVPPKMTTDVTLPGGLPDRIDDIILLQTYATVGDIQDVNGLGPICALNLANTVAYQFQFRSAADAASSGVDIVDLKFASNTTIVDSINYVDTPLNTYLQTHTFDQYKNLTLSGSFTSAGALLGLSPTGTIQDLINAIQSFDGLNPDGTNPQAGSLDFHALNVLIQGNTFTGFDLQKIAGDSTPAGDKEFAVDVGFTTFLQNLANSIKNNPVPKPSGGTFVDTIYFPPTVLYFYNYDTATKIEIFQNNTLVLDTSTAAVLTDADKALLTGPAAENWFNDNQQFFMKDFQNVGSGFVKYAGKLNFNYNPSNGSNFRIKVTSPAGSRWRYVMAYPIDGASVGCIPPTQTFTSTPTFAANYTNVSFSAWCGNGAQVGSGSVSILTGVTETWSAVPTPVPHTSVVPFDINADWYHSLNGQ